VPLLTIVRLGTLKISLWNKIFISPVEDIDSIFGFGMPVSSSPRDVCPSFANAAYQLNLAISRIAFFCS